MAEQVKPPAGRDKERDKQAKIKRMEEIKQKLAEIEKIESAVKTSAEEFTQDVGAGNFDQVADASAEKMKNVEMLSSQLSDIEAMLQKELGGDVAEGEALPKTALEDIENELAKIEQEIATEEQVELTTIFDKVLELYPWLGDPRKAFMYAIPSDPKSKDFTSWREEWSRVLFDFARLSILHVVYLKKLMGEQPFTQFRDRDKAIAAISDYLVGKKLAKYNSKDKEVLRIYWKSYDEWADEVDKWAHDNAILDPVLLMDLREAEQPFSTLLDEDWEEIFKILKKEKKITLIKLDSGETAIKFIF